MAESQQAEPSKREIEEALWDKIFDDKVDKGVAGQILEQMRDDWLVLDPLTIDDFTGAVVDIGERKLPAEKVILTGLASAADFDDVERRCDAIVDAAIGDEKLDKLQMKAWLLAPVRPRSAIEALRRVAKEATDDFYVSYRLGSLLVGERDFEDGERWLRLSLGIGGIPVETRVQVFKDLAKAAEKRGSLPGAEHWLLQALKEDKIAIPERADVTYELQKIVREAGDLPRAFDLARDAHKHFVGAKDEFGVDAAMWALYSIADQRGDLAAAEDWCKRRLAVAKKDGDKADIASWTAKLGAVAGKRGQEGRADNLCTQAAELFEELGRHEPAGDARMQLFHIALGRKREKEASEHLARALSHYEASGNKIKISTCLGLVGSRQFEEKHYKESEESYVRSLAMAAEVGNTSAIAVANLGVAQCTAVRGELAVSHKHATRAAELLDELDIVGLSAFAHGLLGDISAKTGNTAAALASWRASLERYEKAGESSSENARRTVSAIKKAQAK